MAWGSNTADAPGASLLVEVVDAGLAGQRGVREVRDLIEREIPPRHGMKPDHVGGVAAERADLPNTVRIGNPD